MASEIKVSSVKAKDGTAGISIADSTGRVTFTETNPVITLGSNANFDSIAINDLGTASKLLKTNSDGGLGQIHTKRGYTTSTGDVNIYTPSQKELGIVFAFQNIDSTAQGCSIYSAEYPGQYALRLVNLGSSGITIDYTGYTTIKVNSNSAFNWVVISMHYKT